MTLDHFNTILYELHTEASPFGDKNRYEYSQIQYFIRSFNEKSKRALTLVQMLVLMKEGLI